MIREPIEREHLCSVFKGGKSLKGGRGELEPHQPAVVMLAAPGCPGLHLPAFVCPHRAGRCVSHKAGGQEILGLMKLMGLRDERNGSQVLEKWIKATGPKNKDFLKKFSPCFHLLGCVGKLTG